jgi:hypothetical protein
MQFATVSVTSAWLLSTPLISRLFRRTRAKHAARSRFVPGDPFRQN